MIGAAANISSIARVRSPIERIAPCSVAVSPKLTVLPHASVPLVIASGSVVRAVSSWMPVAVLVTATTLR